MIVCCSLPPTGRCCGTESRQTVDREMGDARGGEGTTELCPSAHLATPRAPGCMKLLKLLSSLLSHPGRGPSSPPAPCKLSGHWRFQHLTWPAPVVSWCQAQGLLGFVLVLFYGHFPQRHAPRQATAAAAFPPNKRKSPESPPPPSFASCLQGSAP